KGDKEAPFIASKLKYRFDSQGFLRTRKRLAEISPKIRDLVQGDFDIVDIASNGRRTVFIATMADDDTGLQDVYDLNVTTGKYKKVTTGKGTASSVAVTQDGTVAYIGHREGKKPWVPTKLIFPEKGKIVEVGKSASSSVGCDLFVGPAESLVYDDGLFYLVGQNGGSSAVYSYGKSMKRLTKEKINIRCFDVSRGRLAYVYTSPAKPSILVFGKELDLNPGISGIEPREMKVNSQDAWI
ncbi:acylaminoacyl-peptidase, partial [mine drainage metagenome]